MRKEEKEKVEIELELPEEAWRRLRYEAMRRGLTCGEVIDELVLRYLGKEEPDKGR